MTSHRTVNPGPSMPLASDNAETARRKFAEAGQQLPPPGQLVLRQRAPEASEMIRCPLPNITAWPRVREALETRLAALFGGFTSYSMRGGWVDDNGTLLSEHGLIYEISYAVSASSDWKRKRALAREEFLIAGHAIGEQWVRIELHALMTHCAMVNEKPGPQPDPFAEALRYRQEANRPWERHD